MEFLDWKRLEQFLNLHGFSFSAHGAIAGERGIGWSPNAGTRPSVTSLTLGPRRRRRKAWRPKPSGRHAVPRPMTRVSLDHRRGRDRRWSNSSRARYRAVSSDDLLLAHLLLAPANGWVHLRPAGIDLEEGLLMSGAKLSSPSAPESPVAVPVLVGTTRWTETDRRRPGRRRPAHRRRLRAAVRRRHPRAARGQRPGLRHRTGDHRVSARRPARLRRRPHRRDRQHHPQVRRRRQTARHRGTLLLVGPLHRRLRDGRVRRHRRQICGDPGLRRFGAPTRPSASSARRFPASS